MSIYRPARSPSAGRLRRRLDTGYLTTSGGSLTMRVAPPPAVSAAQAVAYAGTKQVPTSVVGGLVQFTLKTSAGKVADWAVSGPRGLTGSALEPRTKGRHRRPVGGRRSKPRN